MWQHKTSPLLWDPSLLKSRFRHCKRLAGPWRADAHSCAAFRGERTATKNRALTNEGLISALWETWSKICPGENCLVPVPWGHQTTEAVTLLWLTQEDRSASEPHEVASSCLYGIFTSGINMFYCLVKRKREMATPHYRNTLNHICPSYYFIH